MTTNKSIFQQTSFDLPISSELTFHESLKISYRKFLETIELFTGEVKAGLTPHKKIIAEQCDSLLLVVEMFLHGFPGKAFFLLKDCLEKLKDLSLLEIQNSLTAAEKGNLYRVRLDTRSQLAQKDLFHIPFELREKVATQRYSVPGLPCLYLGDSIFVCWEEMNRPIMSALHVSRVDLSISGFKLLDLNISTDEMRLRCFKGKTEKFIPHLVRFIIQWPLLAACSFIVRKPTEVFKPEYIIPQLLLQWVVDAEGVDGIKYKSTRITPGPNNVGSFTNLVIPVKQIETQGFCPILLKKVKLTQPVSWSILDVTDPNREFLNNEAEDINIDSLRRSSFIEVITGERTNYLSSKFGILEEKLKTLPARLLI